MTAGKTRNWRHVAPARQSARGACRSEILLAAGAVNSPHLLQMSGIGPAGHLRSIGVEVGNLRRRQGAAGPLRDARRQSGDAAGDPQRASAGVAPLVGDRQMAGRGRGLLAFSPAHVGVFLRSLPGLDEPDLQFVFTPASYDDGNVTGGLEPLPGMTCGVWQMRPESRGYVRARSPDPDDPPAIQPNYLRRRKIAARRSPACVGRAGCSRRTRSPRIAAEKLCPAGIAAMTRRCSRMRVRAARPCIMQWAAAAWAPIRLPWSVLIWCCVG